MPKKLRFLKLMFPIVLFALSVGVIRSALDIWKSNKRFEDVKSEVSTLENKKKDLDNAIKYKKTDEFIEEKARDDLNLVKPGEIIYVSKDFKQDSGSNVLSGASPRLEKSDTKERGNWYLWYRLFF